jgi:hypothetical protein
LRHDRTTQRRRRKPAIEPMTMPAIAPPLNVWALLPLSPDEVTVTVSVFCRATRVGGGDSVGEERALARMAPKPRSCGELSGAIDDHRQRQ